MDIDASLIEDAIDFLLQGGEIDAAQSLQTCVFVDWACNDSWMDGSRHLDGIDIDLAAPRATYEILRQHEQPITKAIRNALSAVFPADTYLKTIRVRAISSQRIRTDDAQEIITGPARKRLIEMIESQKELMIAVSTGGPRINTVNQEYQDRRLEIRQLLLEIRTQDPNTFPDLWAWYGKWSDGSLPTYQSRRQYIGDMYRPLLDALQQLKVSMVLAEPTGWARVDRNVEKISLTLELARNEEDFQAVALHCREALISLSQAVYNPERHGSSDVGSISSTDSKRMLDAYISAEFPGESNEYIRKHARAAVDLAVNLQHKRSATFRDAALCAEATRSIINTIAILSGRGEPRSGES